MRNQATSTFRQKAGSQVFHLSFFWSEIMIRRTIAVLAILVLTAGTSSAQFLHIGDPDVQLADLTSGGKPNTLTITGLSAISDYAFNGATLDVPFTLSGSGARVWLIVYTAGQSAPFTIEGEGPGPYSDPEHAGAGWHVYDGVDVLVAKTAGERFGAGANVISWNGRDTNGDVVPAGSYDLFLAAFDDEATPHVVGVAARQFGSGKTIYFNTDRGEFINFYDGEVNNMENDWIDNLEGFDLIDNQAVVDACGDREGCGGNMISATPLNAARTEWIGNNRGAQGWLYRFSYDWATRQITMNEDWGSDNGAENGILNTADILPGRQYAIATNPAKDEIYFTAGVSGTVSKISTWKVADAAFVPGKDWDLTDLFLYDNNGADRSGGPGTLARFADGEPDPYGLTMSGHHTSLTMRMDYDGNIKYMNRNGDGFGDSRVFADGSFGDLAYGHTEAPAFKYSLYATDYGWVTNVEAGTDNSKNGFMLGEDGSGLFFFEPKSIPLTWPQYNVVVNEDGDWDGVYMTIGGFGDAALANDFIPEPEADSEGNVPLAILSRYPLVQMPYDHKRVSLGTPATAVLERDGATPEDFSVSDTYPNPFNPETSIRFELPWASAMKVTVYNDQGQSVRTLVNETLAAGTFDITWDGRDESGHSVATGMYLFLIEGPNLRTFKKVTYLK